MPRGLKGAGIDVEVLERPIVRSYLRAPATRRTPGSRPLAMWILVALCLQFAAFGLYEAWHDAPTFDEQYQLASGVSVLTRHQVRVTPEQPPLFPALAALPALVAHPVVPDSAAWRRGDGYQFTTEFMRAQARSGRVREVTFAARLIPLAEAIAVGLVAFVLGAALFGTTAGLLAAGAWLTLPFVLGVGHLDSRDVPLALVTLLLALALLRHLRVPSRGTVVALGAVCGLALLARPTALVLVPVVAAVALFARGRPNGRRVVHAVAVLLLAWTCVWIGYRALVPLPQYRHVTPPGAVGTPLRPVALVAGLGWPREYAVGLRDQAVISDHNGMAYLAGITFGGPRWWYWPVSMAIKMSTTTLLFLGAGLLCWRGLDSRTRRQALVVLALPAAALTSLVFAQHHDVGLRYLLPVIALGLVAAGPVARLATKARATRVLTGAVVAAQLGLLWTSVPRSIAWTMPPLRPGYRLAADSNLDWGQDLYPLQAWVRRHPGAQVFYFGGLPYDGGPRDEASPIADTNGTPLTAGWYAVSASVLTSYLPSIPRLAALLDYCPVGTIGGTILLYRFDRPPGPATRYSGPPLRVCAGGTSRHLWAQR